MAGQMTPLQQAEQVIEDMERWGSVVNKAEMIKILPNHMAEMARRLRAAFRDLQDRPAL